MSYSQYIAVVQQGISFEMCFFAGGNLPEEEHGPQQYDLKGRNFCSIAAICLRNTPPEQHMTHFLTQIFKELEADKDMNFIYRKLRAAMIRENIQEIPIMSATNGAATKICLGNVFRE